MFMHIQRGLHNCDITEKGALAPRRAARVVIFGMIQKTIDDTGNRVGPNAPHGGRIFLLYSSLLMGQPLFLLATPIDVEAWKAPPESPGEMMWTPLLKSVVQPRFIG